jgi:hypothetical protein
MDVHTARRIEWAVMASASAALGVAIAFMLHQAANYSGLTAAVGGGGAFAWCLVLLRKVDATRPRSHGTAKKTPLTDLLAEADRSFSTQPAFDNAESGVANRTSGDSRVVQLFGAPSTKANRAPEAAGDASQALYDALSALRRTLR